MGLFEEVRESLKREFNRRKSANKKYSLRAYARSIGLTPSRMSEILNGKRLPSQVHLEKINQVLGCSWGLQFTSINHIETKPTFREDQLEQISNWIYAAVLTYLKEKKSGHSALQLADYFYTTAQDIQNVLNSLERMKFIQKNDDLYYWKSGPERSTDQIPSKSLRKFHQRITRNCKRKN